MRIIDKKVKLNDMSSWRYTPEGFLVVTANVARSGIQQYTRDSLGLDGEGTINAYRPPDEVFSKESLATYSNSTIVDGHPDDFVTSENWKELSVGHSGNDVLRDGAHIQIPLVFTHDSTIKNIKDGKTQISMGYSMEMIVEDGITPEGEEYGVKFTNIKANHVSLEHVGRAGTATILDKQTQDKEKNMSNVKYVLDNGIEIETTAQGAQALIIAGKVNDALKAKADDALAQVVTLKKRAKKLKGELATANDSLEKAKDNKEVINKAVADRAELLSSANAIIGDKDVTALSNKDIKVLVITDSHPKIDLKDLTNEAIDVHFAYTIGAKKINDGFEAMKIAGKTNDKQDAISIADAWKK